MIRKLCYLLAMICFVGLFSACSDDDNNPVPTPTPDPDPIPEIHSAKDLEGLYVGDAFIAGDAGKDTLEQGKFHIYPTTQNSVKLVTPYISFTLASTKIEWGAITIDSVPSTIIDGVYLFQIKDKAMVLNEKEAKVTVQGTMGADKNMVVNYSIETDNSVYTMRFELSSRLNDQAKMIKMTFNSDLVAAQPYIDGTNVVFYITETAEVKDLKLAPVFELSKGATVSPTSGKVVDFSGAMENGDDTKYVKYVVVSEDGSLINTYNVKFNRVPSFTKTSFEEWVLGPGSEEGDGAFYAPEGKWATADLALGLIRMLAGYDGPNSVVKTADAKAGTSAASITTLNTIGMPSIMPGTFPCIPKVTSGSLFLGAFEVDAMNTLRSTRFGIEYRKEPVRVTGYYKYTPGETYYRCDDINNSNVAVVDPAKTDECSISAVLYEVSSFRAPADAYDPSDERLNGTNIIHPNGLWLALFWLTVLQSPVTLRSIWS